MFYAGLAFIGVAGSYAGPVEEEIITAFEELRRAVLRSDAAAVLTRLAPEHPLAEEYPSEDALAAEMWLRPMPRAEREVVAGLRVVRVEKDTRAQGVFKLVVETPEGEIFTLYAEEHDGRWVFR